MGRLGGGTARNDMNIVGGPQYRPIPAEKFTADPFEAVACNSRPDLFGNGYSETGVEVMTAVKNENKMPTEKTVSAFAELKEFGSFA